MGRIVKNYFTYYIMSVFFPIYYCKMNKYPHINTSTTSEEDV